MVFRRYPAGGGERLLALALADCANPDGTRVFPSVALLAQMSAQSQRSVQRQITAMLATGWLVLVRRSSGRPGDATEYRISPQWIAGGEPVPPPATPDRATRKKPVTGDKLAPVQAVDKSPRRVTPEVETGDTAVSPNPSIPVIEENPPTPLPGGARVKTPEPEDPAADEAQAVQAAWLAITEAYPRRAKLHLARAELQALQSSGQRLTSEWLATVLAGLQRWQRSDEWARDGGRWIPRLHEWLRDQRWRDAPGQGASAPVAPTVLPALPPARPVPACVRELAQRLRRGRSEVCA